MLIFELFIKKTWKISENSFPKQSQFFLFLIIIIFIIFNIDETNLRKFLEKIGILFDAWKTTRAATYRLASTTK